MARSSSSGASAAANDGRPPVNDGEAREKFGGYSSSITQSRAQREAGTIGIVAGIILLVVLVNAYYIGGYVACRMSRFDGARQGLPGGST